MHVVDGHLALFLQPTCAGPQLNGQRYAINVMQFEISSNVSTGNVMQRQLHVIVIIRHVTDWPALAPTGPALSAAMHQEPDGGGYASWVPNCPASHDRLKSIIECYRTS